MYATVSGMKPLESFIQNTFMFEVFLKFAKTRLTVRALVFIFPAKM
jgi:hypothetical protein